jgi:hypothetical protein
MVDGDMRFINFVSFTFAEMDIRHLISNLHRPLQLKLDDVSHRYWQKNLCEEVMSIYDIGMMTAVEYWEYRSNLGIYLRETSDRVSAAMPFKLSDSYHRFDTIDEVSILALWVANRASLTLQSFSAHDRIEFHEKLIIFVGNLRQLYPWLPMSRCLPSIPSSHTSLTAPQFENFQLSKAMRRQGPVWNGVLLSIVDSQTHSV